MNENNRLFIEISTSQMDDFQQFLNLHQGVASFQKIGENSFQVSLKPLPFEYISAFIQGITEIFSVQKIKKVEFCQAFCRDGSGCLNQAKKGDYCSKHRRPI